MIDTNDFKNGLSFMLDGNIFTIVEFQHHKPGKGAAYMRSKLRNVRTGAIIDRTFRAGERFDQAILDRRKMQLLYVAGDEMVFMDNESYDQVSVPRARVGDQAKYLKEGMEAEVLSHDDEVLGVEIPLFLALEVTQTDPGLKGDTASGGSKPATVEGGAVVQVPLFINIGDKIRVDTRTDSYIERAKG